MVVVNIGLVVALIMLVAAAFLLGRHLQRRAPREEFSAVTRQHFELFQGGRLNEAALERTKRRFAEMLEHGDVRRVEASLRPGMHYVVQVRALAELGTEQAGRILERQLQRRLSDDRLEQAWYWIDLAGGLRALNRQESLPHLLRCSEMAGDVPLGHFFAAETVCFLGFPGYLQQPHTPLGQAALRVLHRALEGLRYGVQPSMVVDARLGEVIEDLWDQVGDDSHPLLVRIAFETRRFLRRAPHALALLENEPAECEAFQWQLTRLEALDATLAEYLEKASAQLIGRIAGSNDRQRRDLFLALLDLQIDTGDTLIRSIGAKPNLPGIELALELLAYARHPRVGPWLCEYASSRVPMRRRAQWRPWSEPPRRPSLPIQLPYRAVLRALRGQPSAQTERFLILAARDWDPLFRAAALTSLGWWDPILKKDVLEALHNGSRDPCTQVRKSARAALARLGQRAALHWFRQGLRAEDPHAIHETIQLIVTEGLTLLWPDLDRLAESDNPDLALLAKEALERLSEGI
ncbi:MAG: HEAT repeat domain-containing protein [Gemmataceae bacterium]|nr:HEAT repeat domain-containing protein [Gemmataceae bacterium]